MALRRTFSRRCSSLSASNWQPKTLSSSAVSAGILSMKSDVGAIGKGRTSTVPSAVAGVQQPNPTGPSMAINTTSAVPDTTTTALASPLVPRVLSWFKPGAPFDMEHVVAVLQERGVEIDCSYPLLHSQQPSTTSTSTAATTAAAATAAIKNRHASSSTASTQQKTGGTRLATSAKDVEVIGFSVRQSSLGKDTNATEGGTREGGEHNAAVPKTTYFVFAEGSLVGWNCSWDELVWMRGMLQPPNMRQADGSQHSTSSPTMSRIAAAMPYGLVSLVPSSLRHRIAPHSAASPAQPTNSTAAVGSAAAAGGRAPTPSSSLAIESMRYQLFMTLPMTERPQDSEQDDPQSYIDVHHDRIILQDDVVSTKLPFSFALVQSVQLEALHTALEPVTLVVKRWQQQLSIDGRLVCTLKSLRKAKTQLLSIVESLNFRHHTHTTPRIFWSGDFHALRGHYRDACEHLEIEDRASSLKAQLESIDESLSYLHDEAHASHNEWLTWVIIILITMEVAVALGVLDRIVPLLDVQIRWVYQLLVRSTTSNHTRREEEGGAVPLPITTASSPPSEGG